MCGTTALHTALILDASMFEKSATPAGWKQPLPAELDCEGDESYGSAASGVAGAWGPWAGAGMAAADPGLLARLHRQGLSLLHAT